jgi:hypothetical protein
VTQQLAALKKDKSEPLVRKRREILFSDVE